MRKLLLGLLIAIVFVSCVGYRYGSSIKLDGKKHATAYIEYKSNKFLVEEVKKKSSINLWDSLKIKEELKYKPIGGYVYCHVYGYTIASANTKYWTCVVFDKNGKEIIRKVGNDNIPNMPTHRENDPSGKMWSNLLLVRLDTNITDFFKVRLIDGLGDKYNDYLVYPNQDLRGK